MNKNLLGGLALGIASMGFQANAQDHRECAAHDVLEQQIQQNPKIAQNQAKIERITQQYIQDMKAGRVVNGNVVIPCIVHVVYANNAQNISDNQIQSQMDRLNADYAATNSDYNNAPSEFAGVRSGNTGISFELIEVKRYANSNSSWGTNDNVKSQYPPIEPSRILNMWVCEIGGGILGYAQFPGGSPSTDGVVMSPQYFGDASWNGGSTSGFNLSAPFNLGRTATHEVGHWLNLRHIWGDGNCNADDFVSDTPYAGGANYGCPSYPTNSCTSKAGNDMTMNYMDYSDDACMYMFSSGQDARMQATFQNGGGREGFLLDPTYTPGGGGGTPPPTGGSCDDTEVAFNLTFDQYPSETTWTLTGPSGTVASGNGSGAAANSSTSETFCLADGEYTFTINDSYGDGICCSYGNGSFSLTSGGTTLAAGGSFTNSDSQTFTIGSGGSTPPPTGGGGGTVEETCGQATGVSVSRRAWQYYTVTIPSGTTNWTVTTTGGSGDADLYVNFGSNPTTRNNDGESEAGGNDESISLTDPQAGSWTIGIYGYRAASGITVRSCVTAPTARFAGVNLRSAGSAVENTSELLAYPNPTTNILNVKLASGNTSLEVISLTGQIVFKADNANKQTAIDVSKLETGIYILKAKNENGVFTQRFTKQ